MVKKNLFIGEKSSQKASPKIKIYYTWEKSLKDKPIYFGNEINYDIEVIKLSDLENFRKSFIKRIEEITKVCYYFENDKQFEQNCGKNMKFIRPQTLKKKFNQELKRWLDGN